MYFVFILYLFSYKALNISPKLGFVGLLRESKADWTRMEQGKPKEPTSHRFGQLWMFWIFCIDQGSNSCNSADERVRHSKVFFNQSWYVQIQAEFGDKGILFHDRSSLSQKNWVCGQLWHDKPILCHEKSPPQELSADFCPVFLQTISIHKLNPPRFSTTLPFSIIFFTLHPSFRGSRVRVFLHFLHFLLDS